MPLQVPKFDYHSAHKRPVDSPVLSRWEGERCAAFVHDLMSSPTLPPEFSLCDVFLVDPPWQKGYGTFNERAMVSDGRTYAGFLRRVSEIIESETAPMYLVTGRHALSRLPQADVILPMRLNEDDATVIGYRSGNEAEDNYGVVQEFLHALAQRYEAVGDFCCGYGRTARFFLQAGKSAVVSDFNPQCIGYIAEHAPGWSTS